jgi:hypothetical protein
MEDEISREPQSPLRLSYNVKKNTCRPSEVGPLPKGAFAKGARFAGRRNPRFHRPFGIGLAQGPAKNRDDCASSWSRRDVARGRDRITHASWAGQRPDPPARHVTPERKRNHSDCGLPKGRHAGSQIHCIRHTRCRQRRSLHRLKPCNGAEAECAPFNFACGWLERAANRCVVDLTIFLRRAVKGILRRPMP